MKDFIVIPPYPQTLSHLSLALKLVSILLIGSGFPVEGTCPVHLLFKLKSICIWLESYLNSYILTNSVHYTH